MLWLFCVSLILCKTSCFLVSVLRWSFLTLRLNVLIVYCLKSVCVSVSVYMCLCKTCFHIHVCPLANGQKDNFLYMCLYVSFTALFFCRGGQQRQTHMHIFHLSNLPFLEPSVLSTKTFCHDHGERRLTFYRKCRNSFYISWKHTILTSGLPNINQVTPNTLHPVFLQEECVFQVSRKVILLSQIPQIPVEVKHCHRLTFITWGTLVRTSDEKCWLFSLFI